MESAGTPRISPAARLGWSGGWVALLALALWMHSLSATWVLLAALGATAWAAGAAAGMTRGRVAVLLVLWAAVGIATGVQLRLRDVAEEWARVHLRVEERAAAALRAALDDAVDRGERAVMGAEAIPVEARNAGHGFANLDRLRRASGLSALAIYGPDAAPLLWSGEHRGMVPLEVRRGEREFSYNDGPLFGYLYFAHTFEDGRTSVAAALLEAGVPAGPRRGPFAERFAARHGITPRFSLPERAHGESVWDWSTPEGPILSVSFLALTQEHWRDRIANRGRWVVLCAWVLALLLLGAGWYREHAGTPAVPIALGTLSLLLVPLSSLMGAQGLFSPLQFVLPAGGDITLGELLVVLVGCALWVVAQPPASRMVDRLPLLLRAGIAGLVVPLLLLVVRQSGASGLFATQGPAALPLQLATVLLLTIPFFVLLLAARPPADGEGRAAQATVAGGLLAVTLGIGLVIVWRPWRPIPLWTGALWGVPFLLLALALRRARRSHTTLLTWLAAGTLASTAALPQLWALHMDARLEAAERELGRLGTEADPFLDFLLRTFADRVRELAQEGEDGVNLLYRAWVASNLARESYEARLTLWIGMEPLTELQLSDLELPSRMVPEILATADTARGPVLELYRQVEDVHYLLTVPLDDGRVVSVVVPPRRRVGRVTALGRFLHPGGDPVAAGEFEPLSLVPVFPTEVDTLAGPAHAAPAIRWVPARAGWRSEALVHYPAGPMHAHLVVRTTSLPLLLVRALLVQMLLFAFLALLWALARTLCGEPLGLPTSRWLWLRSFRGRLTLALFTFFLIPTVAMGAVAYGALAREVVRTEAALARRSLEQAAPGAGTETLAEVGRRVRMDLLLYQQGALVDASAPEVLDLGLFHTWLSPDVFLRFASGEETEDLEERRLAGSEYLVAYRRLAPDQVLGAPTPLASGEIARRQRTFAEVVLLAVLFGAAFSIVLALAVGRAFSRPIETLSRAAAAVGAGNLRVRLPEGREDEFGGVFRSFNRMVRRLRRARAAELRSARVLAWGEMARQVAHEIKNPLTPIKLSVQHLRRAYRDGKSDFGQLLERNVESVLSEIDRLSEIARAFARFGTPDRTRASLEPVRLSELFEETLALYRGGEDGIEYRVAVAPETPPALARPGELKEVLVNLLENAREAIGGARSGDGAASDLHPEIRIAAAPDRDAGWVRLKVADTGEGIPPEVLRRIFEPQFSTRTSGTGLGLAIVRRLVESWGGEVTAESEQGAGTTIHLRLRSAGAALERPPDE